MEVKAYKRPFWGLDRYLHFVILGLSLLNLVNMTPSLFSGITINTSASVCLSFLGVYAFLLIYKNQKGGAMLAMIWSVFQLIIITSTKSFMMDLSQGISFPLGFSTETRTNGISTSGTSININVVAAMLLSIAYYRFKRSFNYIKFTIIPEESVNIKGFNTEIIKTYTFGEDKNMHILSQTAGTKNYAIQSTVDDKFNIGISEIDYLIFEIDSRVIKNETLKPYDFKQLGSVQLSQT